jgi:hypothetical protein
VLDEEIEELAGEEGPVGGERIRDLTGPPVPFEVGDSAPHEIRLEKRLASAELNPERIETPAEGGIEGCAD